MKKTGIFYGTTTGTTGTVAREIANRIGVADADIHDVANTAPDRLGDYDLLILGSSTWGSGDLQDDWYNFLDGAQALALNGKTIALFGCGDETMSDTFCNAIATIYKGLKDSGATFIGQFNADGYDFAESEARLDDGQMLGLTIDQVNHPDLTDARIDAWTKLLK